MEYDAALRDREQALNGPVPILKRKTRAPIYKQKSSIMSFIYFSKTHTYSIPPQSQFLAIKGLVTVSITVLFPEYHMVGMI